MIVVHLDAASLARVRLAVSPASEAVMWLRLAATGERHGVFGDPGPATRFALRDPDVALLAKLLSGSARYVPDLLTPKPPPGTARRALAEQLAEVGATPAQTVVEQLADCPPVSAEVRDAAERGSFARRAASALDRFWRHAVADSWPALYRRMQADLSIRSKTMATHGVGAVLATLHPSMAWTGSTLEMCKGFDDECHFDGEELVLAPSVLAWPKLVVQVCDPRSAVLCYPVFGLGVPDADAGGARALGRLLGDTRATLLRDLDVARSTTDLSARHRLAPATVSYHLRVLHGSGLVTRMRDRRSVLYRRTEQGDALHG